MGESKVYFTSFKTTEHENLIQKLHRLMKQAGFENIDFNEKYAAIKIHFGEYGNLAFLRPNYAKVVADYVKELGGKAFLTDCNTLYVGSRKNALDHLDTAYVNGFSPLQTGCHVIIGDGLKGTDETIVPIDGEYVKEAKIGHAIMDADVFISLTHFKGHETAGFGGAIKNIGMGCGSRAGKMEQHAQGKPEINENLCRGCIIDKLFNSFLMEKKGNEIHVTGKGKQLLELVPSELKKPELTAAWEMKLSGIAKGNLQEKAFIEEISDYTEELIREIKSGTQTFRHDNLTNKKCPQCGKRLLAVNGKNSKMLVCQDRECGYRETLSRTSNARCPKCHKKMELYGKGEDQTFICKCGYKEKLSAFKNRREKEGAGVSKRDVQSYLKKQQKEAAKPLNNAFAAAFAKLDIK